MTSKERTLRILNHQSVDRLPIFDCVVNDAVIEHYSGEKLTVANGPRVVLSAIDNFLDATRWIIMFPQVEETIALPDGRVIEQRRWTAWHGKKAALTLDDAVQMLRTATEEEAARDVEKTAQEFDAGHQVHLPLGRQHHADPGRLGGNRHRWLESAGDHWTT